MGEKLGPGKAGKRGGKDAGFVETVTSITF